MVGPSTAMNMVFVSLVIVSYQVEGFTQMSKLRNQPMSDLRRSGSSRSSASLRAFIPRDENEVQSDGFKQALEYSGFEDVAAFDLRDEKWSEWASFLAATGSLLTALSYLWFLPGGPHLGDAYLHWVETLVVGGNDGIADSAAVITAMLGIFAVAHSGLAALRQSAETIAGSRAYRVLFASVSLPLALSAISYFVAHCHDGPRLLPSPFLANGAYDPLLHGLFVATNFISFFFLYPSTFELLDVAAVRSPRLRLFAPKGILRITRHPQATGQCLWCLAHSLTLGTKVVLAASTVLVAHHIFACWHGDRRMADIHGEDYAKFCEVTSIVPYVAILEKRQTHPSWREFATPPYALVTIGTLAAYKAHPFMVAGAALLGW